ncbi:MAG: glycosyl hydrolase family 18 protein [Clostridiaceae bacterium]|uniref:LysM peptidoglycan-binding domain-containing protein n=1 Tax=Clostridium porci TaxID=2605778 RepID=A0A7X2NPB4_9CLOT|nr:MULTISPECIES: glycosyl hydrolase family 18 protein [Clostridium]MCI6138687.1 glycosyl hydrolase family 18 protein [Clostridium sp.]MDY3229977.1 glycosyl hydrolase family 18 protein [Clostridiaceae bacterium]MSS38565.1 LysM peptidoglycan-binding domain-containing protein [Clostridium porci]
MDIYVVKQGDNVDSIVALAGIPVETLIRDNQIPYPFRLAVGQALFISDGTAATDRRPLHSGGYAYPFIRQEVLDETLLYLTSINVFSYGFTMEGNLIPPMADDQWMIGRAWEKGVRPILTLTPLGEDGRFNNNLVSNLVRNQEVQQHLIWELGQTLQEKGFAGVDIDFEYVLAEDREEMAAFVRKTTQVMNLFGYTVSVALAPKTSAQQRGLLYEGIDYRLLGEAANRVLLMAYEWGYTYGPPMAVAPVNMVRRVVDYAVSVIPREKISLGIPNYGYDWPLPYERGVTKAQTLSHQAAIQLAIDHGTNIQFDETAMSPFFRYWQYGIQHEVWFEDVRSIKAKFDLVKEYGLSGTGYWQLMSLFRANWLMMEELFYIERDWPLKEELEAPEPS